MSTNSKKQKKFLKLFNTRLTSSNSNDKRVIEKFSCAVLRNKGILHHGTLFLTEKYFAFHSNIFGCQTYLLHNWSEVIQLNKENIALLFPTAIRITTNTKDYFLASFLSRNYAFKIIQKLWEQVCTKDLSFHSIRKNSCICFEVIEKENKKIQHIIKDYKEKSDRKKTQLILNHNNNYTSSSTSQINASYLCSSSSEDEISCISCRVTNQLPIGLKKCTSEPALKFEWPPITSDHAIAVTSSFEDQIIDQTSASFDHLTTENILAYKLKIFISYFLVYFVFFSEAAHGIIETKRLSNWIKSKLIDVLNFVCFLKVTSHATPGSPPCLTNILLSLLVVLMLALLYIYYFLILFQINQIENKLVYILNGF